jgi:hypothetical protein
MPVTVRPATDDDLDAIAALTAAHRRALAAWSPVWWRVAPGADEVHRMWLGYLVGAPDRRVLVAAEAASGEVVGCVVVNPQPGQWFVDDVAVAGDDRWADAGAALVAAVDERPALTCLATLDGARAAGLAGAGLAGVSSYWVGATVPGESPALAGWGDGRADAVEDPPPHTFVGLTDPAAADTLVLTDADGGIVVGSRPVTAPPVYGPGGTVCLVDRVVGADTGARARLVTAVRAVAAARGDTLVAVVVGADDADLTHVLAVAGFERTVEVYAWPVGGS